MPFHRKRWDSQPTGRCDVLLASDGRREFSQRAVAQAAALAGKGGTVAVITIAKIHGTQFGLPHPGLLPTKRELAERTGWVERAIRELSKNGVSGDGQVAATRRASKKLAAAARIRGVRAVVIDETAARGLRRIVEGDTGAELRRRLRRAGVDVHVVPSSSNR